MPREGTVKVMSKADVQQEVKAMKVQTNIIDLENDIRPTSSRSPTPTSRAACSRRTSTATTVNVSSTAATASANYSYMSVSAWRRPTPA